MTTHTPGPWICGTYDHATYEITGPQGQLPVIARIPRERAERSANAALISAAPEILEALQYLLSEVEGHDDAKTLGELGAIGAASAAIRKALGQK